MTFVTGFVLYVVIWWVTIFMVLPWGNAPSEKIILGHAPEAPKEPRILLKLTLNSLIAFVLWGGIYTIIKYRLIPLDDICIIKVAS